MYYFIIVFMDCVSLVNIFTIVRQLVLKQSGIDESCCRLPMRRAPVDNLGAALHNGFRFGLLKPESESIRQMPDHKYKRSVSVYEYVKELCWGIH